MLLRKSACKHGGRQAAYCWRLRMRLVPSFPRGEACIRWRPPRPSTQRRGDERRLQMWICADAKQLSGSEKWLIKQWGSLRFHFPVQESFPVDNFSYTDTYFLLYPDIFQMERFPNSQREKTGKVRLHLHVIQLVKASARTSQEASTQSFSTGDEFQTVGQHGCKAANATWYH